MSPCGISVRVYWGLVRYIGLGLVLGLGSVWGLGLEIESDISMS